MDFTGIIGCAAGLGLVLWGCLQGGGSLHNFINGTSVAITLGGTVCAVLLSFPASCIAKIPAQLRLLTRSRPYDPRKYLERVVQYAEEARRRGLLSLEESSVNEPDEFFRRGMMLAVDAVEPAKIRAQMQEELDALDARHEQSCRFYEKAAAFAPAFGVIGTFVLLIRLLAGFQLTEPNAAQNLLGGMASSLLTSFYGILLSNLVFLPIAQKLRRVHEEEMLCRQIAVEGILSIQAGEKPENVQQKLNAFVEETRRIRPEAFRFV